MKLFNFSFPNDENIILLLLIIIVIIIIVSILNKSTTKSNNTYNTDNNNTMWLPYEQFEPVDNSEPQLELIFPGKSFEAPIIEEPRVINQLELQEKQINQLELQEKQINQLELQQKQINELELQQKQINQLELQQKQINQLELQQKQINELEQQIPISSLNNEQILMMSQEASSIFVPFVKKSLDISTNIMASQEQVSQKQVSQEQVSQKQVEDNYAGFNNEIDYTNVEQTQIPVEQKVSPFNYNKSVEQVNPIDMLDNYSSF
jgi:hypothetical protein